MDITTNILLATQTPLTQLGAADIDFLTDIPKAMYVLVMIIVLFLPLLMIPYIFVKMGSMAGKVQASLNSVGRGMRKGAWKGIKRTAMKEGKGAARNAWENKAGKWAGLNDGSMRSKIGGFKDQRDFARNQRADIAKRRQNEAILGKIGTGDNAFARSITGGSSLEGDRLQAMVKTQEKKASDERINNKIVSYSRQKDLKFDQLHGDFERAHAANDYEGMAASFRQVTSMGAGGMASGASWLQGKDGSGLRIDDDDTRQKFGQLVGVEMYDSLVGKQGHVAKGGFEDDPEKEQYKRFKYGEISALGTQHAATTQFNVYGAPVLDENTKQVVGITAQAQKNFKSLTQQQALSILSNPNLEAAIPDEFARAAIHLRSQGIEELPMDLVKASHEKKPVPEQYIPPKQTSAPPPPSAPPTSPPPQQPDEDWRGDGRGYL